jgi:hypothetical protein
MAYCHTTEKLYYVVALPVEAAELAELTLRPGLGPGLGYQFVESEAMNLQTELGILRVHEDFKTQEDNNYRAASGLIDFDN